MSSTGSVESSRLAHIKSAITELSEDELGDLWAWLPQVFKSRQRDHDAIAVRQALANHAAEVSVNQAVLHVASTATTRRMGLSDWMRKTLKVLSRRSKNHECRRDVLMRDLVRQRENDGHRPRVSERTTSRDLSDDDFASIAGALAHVKGEDLLVVPVMMSFQSGQAVRRLMQAMVSDIAYHDAPVFITFAMGERELDARGFGPGAMYAAAVAKAFHDEGVRCFSSLMIPTGVNSEIFGAQLARRVSPCKILLVLQTSALYSSKPCLTEIYAAQKSNIDIIPLRFELDLPPLERQWTQIAESSDMDGVLMLTQVQQTYCLLDSFPQRPRTMLSDPHALQEIVHDVKTRLMDPDEWNRRRLVSTLGRSNSSSSTSVPPWRLRSPRTTSNGEPEHEPEDELPNLFGSSDVGEGDKSRNLRRSHVSAIRRSSISSCRSSVSSRASSISAESEDQEPQMERTRRVKKRTGKRTSTRDIDH